MAIMELSPEEATKMTRLELLTLLLSIQALLESGNVDKAKEVIAEVIQEARESGKRS